MKRQFFILATIVLLLAMTGCGSGTFTIKDENFRATDICDGTGTYEISMGNGDVHAKTQGSIQTKMLKSGLPSAWCHGLTHQFVTGNKNI